MRVRPVCVTGSPRSGTYSVYNWLKKENEVNVSFEPKKAMRHGPDVIVSWQEILYPPEDWTYVHLHRDPVDVIGSLETIMPSWYPELWGMFRAEVPDVRGFSQEKKPTRQRKNDWNKSLRQRMAFWLEATHRAELRAGIRCSINRPWEVRAALEAALDTELRGEIPHKHGRPHQAVSREELKAADVGLWKQVLDMAERLGY